VFRKWFTAIGITLGLASEYAIGQAHLEPDRGIWSQYRLDVLASGRDSLLRDFSYHPFAQVVCIPHDGIEWAVDVETIDSVHFTVRAAQPQNALGIYALDDPNAKLKRFRATPINRFVSDIDSGTAVAYANVLSTFLGNVRYSNEPSQYISGPTFYFSEGYSFSGHSGMIHSPEVGSPTAQLAKVSWLLFQYATEEGRTKETIFVKLKRELASFSN
jgi:hypothetical protein